MGLQKRYEVYVLLDGERVIKYVGSTGNPQQRKTAHLYSFDKHMLMYETYQVYDKKEDAQAAERELIVKLTAAGEKLLNHIGLEIMDEVRIRGKEVMMEDSDAFYYVDRLKFILEKKEKQGKRLKDVDIALLEMIFRKLEEN